MPTLGHKAYVQLKAKLTAGEFPPGSQLVNRTVSQSIGMSMTPVREAVARLASEGIIHHIPGSGAFVRKISRQEFAQLYDLREVLEPFAAEQAAAHITANELAELRSVCRSWRSVIEAMIAGNQAHATPEQMRRWNDDERRFHDLIFKASRNTWLIKIAGDLQLMTFGFCPQRSVPEFLTPATARKAYRDHIRILKALRDRDAERIRTLTKRHIRVGRKRVLAHLDGRTTSDHSTTPGKSNPGRPDPTSGDSPVR
jgi:DNA-binding GntR family transcriptional regulator